ncbi:MAG: hypothetical protein ACRD2G_05700 [Terriglobia bacterium]
MSGDSKWPTAQAVGKKQPSAVQPRQGRHQTTKSIAPRKGSNRSCGHFVPTARAVGHKIVAAKAGYTGHAVSYFNAYIPQPLSPNSRGEGLG